MWCWVTPLLSWPINKSFDPRTGILHCIVRDPQGIPKIPLTRSVSSIWGRYSPLKCLFLQRPLQTSDWAANGGNEYVVKFWCVKKKFQYPSIISWDWWAPINKNGWVDPDNLHLQLNLRSVVASGEINSSGMNISPKWNSQNGSMLFLGSPEGP